MRNAAIPIMLALAASGAALAQQPQAPTPVPQTVVVPSLPDQKNKEGVVSPGATQKTDGGGWVQTNMDPNAVKPTPAPAGAPGPGIAAPAPGPGIGVPAPPPSVGTTGKPVVDAANLTLRGVVKAFETGVSVTITEANGKDRTVPLAAKAAVYDGIAVGDKVSLRVPLRKPADGKHADRVERQKAPAAAPKSKFAAAQTPPG